MIVGQMNSKQLLPGLGYGAQPPGHQQFSLAAAAVTLASGQLNGQLNNQLNGQLNGQLGVSSPAAGQPALFHFPNPAPGLTSPVANSLPLVTSNGLLGRDEEGQAEYLKHLNALHYIKQLQQNNQINSINSSVKSEPPTESENCSSPKLLNGQSNLADSTGSPTKLAKPQPVRHLSNTSGLSPTSK